jgi:hypothetical protein
MAFNFRNELHSDVRIFLKQFFQQLPQMFAPILTVIRRMVFYFVEELGPVFGVKWRQAVNQFINYGAWLKIKFT